MSRSSESFSPQVQMPSGGERLKPVVSIDEGKASAKYFVPVEAGKYTFRLDHGHISVNGCDDNDYRDELSVEFNASEEGGDIKEIFDKHVIVSFDGEELSVGSTLSNELGGLNFTLDHLTGANYDLQTEDGDILIKDCVGRIEAKSTNINVKNFEGEIYIEGGGDVNMKNMLLEGRANEVKAGGGIYLGLGEESFLRVIAINNCSDENAIRPDLGGGVISSKNSRLPDSVKREGYFGSITVENEVILQTSGGRIYVEQES